jgi:hypothetical protein
VIAAGVFATGHPSPVTRGGTSKASNLVAACWPCNFSKGNLTLSQPGRELLPSSASKWDGLSGHLGALPDGKPWRIFSRMAAIEKPEVLAKIA